MYFTVELVGGSPQYTFTCISTGRPVYNVRWYIYKWKNHFYKMKGDVGMSGHEKERKQEDAYTKIQTHS